MKFLLLSSIAVFLFACSSPSTTSGGDQEVQLFVGGAPYSGTYSNNRGDDSGTIVFSLNQDELSVSGLVTINDSACLQSGQAEGQIIGTNLSLSVPIGDNGVIAFNLRATSDSLVGEYTVSGDFCSNATGTGTVDTAR